MKNKSANKIIEEVCEDICDNYCKYSDILSHAIISDEELDKFYEEHCNDCPLNKLR